MVCKQDIFSVTIVFPLLTSLFALACTYSTTARPLGNFIVALWIDFFIILIILQEELEHSPIVIIKWLPCASRRFCTIKPAASMIYVSGICSQCFLDYVFTLTFSQDFPIFLMTNCCRIYQLEKYCCRKFCPCVN